jgi:hypothetical protein
MSISPGTKGVSSEADWAEADPKVTTATRRSRTILMIWVYAGFKIGTNNTNFS